ncbi:MAG: stage V sporulation protein AD [Clostridia bacterium]|nr:stage V sporulation protein AD [Clostridia bacterium]
MRDIIKLENAPRISSYYSVVGSHERNGPLGDRFDEFSLDDKFEKDSWEKSESEMQRLAVVGALKKGDLKDTDIDLLLAGDLLNQCVGSNYGLVDFDIPYVGLYGACSTCALGLALGALLYNSGSCKRLVSVTSSHFCASERQFRFPLEYGGQRTPTSQWTVTGSGAFVLGNEGKVSIKEIVFGKSVDMGINDINNMGAAMAPACIDTIKRYFSNSDYSVEDFDLIATGDLGYEGSKILRDLLLSEGIDIRKSHDDCGLMIYDRKRQDKHAGGSGCGCSASVLAGDIMKRLEAGELKRVLFIGTGALMSPLTLYQGGSIPAVAHLVHLEG